MGAIGQFPGGGGGAKIEVTNNRPYGYVERVSIPTNRSTGISMALDGNGNILVGDGAESDVIDKIAPDGTITTLLLSSERNYICAATDGNGSVLFAGGRLRNASYGTSNAAITVVDKFSSDGTRTSLNLSAGRCSLSSATDGNGNVLFGGGVDQSSNSNVTVDKFTPDGARSTLSLSIARYGVSATTDGNGNVLFAGGQAGSIYDRVDKFAPNGSRSTLQLAEARNSIACAKDGNGNALFGGGSGSNVVTSLVDKFAPDGTRSALSLSVRRHTMGAATDGDGSVLFAGGYDFNGSKSFQIVDRITKDGVRTTITPLLTPIPIAKGISDISGNVYFGPDLMDSGHYALNKYSPEPVQYTVPAGTVYKYQGQEEMVTSQQITLKFGRGTGYVKLKNSNVEVS